jgi:hypothetical protein
VTTKTLTTEPVQPGSFTGTMPEFGRVADVTRNFGIKRGTLYNLHRDGKVRGVLLRVRGQKSGVRLFDLASVRDFIRSQSNAETKTPN